jgi:outer membrane protein assembly factor BamD (BamD/ComL family)
MHVKIKLALLCAILFAATGCSSRKDEKQINMQKKITVMQTQLKKLLDNTNLNPEGRYAVINSMANNLIAEKNYNQLILFLSDWVERHPKDTYNTYWLFMTAYVYMQQGADPMAAYYFDRILQDYPDIMVKNQSVHFLCLQHLIRISTRPSDRIKYFNELISRFPSSVNITELYIRLALEYEKEGEWDQALKACSLFIEQPDAATIQIAGVPDAYANAKQLVDFNNSPKDWTFESLDALETAVKNAISAYDWHSLDKYKSKVNFFVMNWNQTGTDSSGEEEFSMRNFMLGNSIHFNPELDDTSNPNEAYLKTWGWSQYISVWYLYFRKVNFPVDPEIHGRWEWAGIYFGEKF